VITEKLFHSTSIINGARASQIIAYDP